MPRLLRIVVVISLCVAASACASRGGPLDAETAHQLYLRAHHELQKGEYAAAVNNYKKLVRREAPAPFLDQAFVELAYAYYKKRDYTAVRTTVNDFLQRYPAHPRADYMHYLRATAGMKLTLSIDEADPARRAPALTETYADFRKLSEVYPDSDYQENILRDTRIVQEQLASIRLEQARAALRRGDLNGFALARRVDDEFPGTPAARAALALISDPEAFHRKSSPAAAAPPPPPVETAAVPRDEAPEPRIPIHDPQWILRQDPDRYTVELISGASTEAVRRFVDQHNVRGSARYPVNREQARDALIHGLYPDADSARRAAQQLMQRWGLREAPVRRLAEVQKKLHNVPATQP